MLHIAPVDDFRILKHKASGKAVVLSYCLIYSSRTGEILQKRLARDNVVAATTFKLLVKIKPIFQNLVFTYHNTTPLRQPARESRVHHDFRSIEFPVPSYLQNLKSLGKT